MADQRYKIYEQLGAGGNGAVFRAYDTQLKRWVAIKRLISASEISADDALVAELRREADTLASLRNANIVTIFDVSSDDEGLFIVMELLEGPDLADATQHGPLSLEDFKQLAEQTLEALLAAHQLRILHRDLKPENIKVERLPGGRFQAKIIDFGLARAGLGARKQTEDQAGSVMGSIYYMAPEQLSREPTDVRTDIYSLGCVFYEALSSRKAFDGKSVAEVIDKHLDHDVVPLDALCPHLPQWLTYWVMRLMARKPEDRPAHAQQAIEEYRAWEKLPPAPGMMTWMPMNYGYGYPQQTAPQQYTTDGVPLYVQPGSGSVPVPVQTTGYYAPAHATSSSVPVHPGAPQYQQPMYAAPVAPPATKGNGGMKWALIGGGVAVAAIAAFFGLKGSTPPPKPTGGQPAPAPATTVDVGPPRENLFPGDRPFPPPEKLRVVHFIAKTATRGYNGKAIPSKNDSNSPVSVWDDLTSRGDNTPLVSVGMNPDTSPQRVKWTNDDGLVKSDRYALEFKSKSGRTVTMRLYQPEKHKDAFPFGTVTPPFPPGLTLGVVFQPGGQLPCRVLRLASADGKSSVVIRVRSDKNIEAELQDGAGKKVLTSAKVDGTKPCLAMLVWNSETNDIQFRTRDAFGNNHKAADKLPVPQSPLFNMDLGGVADTPDQFNGLIAECGVFATAIHEDQCSLWEKDLRDQYFTSGPTKPVKDRIQSKLPYADNAAKKWKLTANPPKDANLAADGNLGTRWTTGASMGAPNQWIQIELPDETDLAGIVLDAPSPGDFPRGYRVESSLDGKAWAKVMDGEGKQALTEITFPKQQRLRYLKITETGKANNFWSIDEILLLKPN